MVHRGRVVERVACRQQGVRSGCVAQDPVLLEPGDVADLPEKGIEDLELRDAELLVGEIVEDLQRASPGVPDPAGELVRVDIGRAHGWRADPGSYRGRPCDRRSARLLG